MATAMMTEARRFIPERLQEFCTAVFMKAGARPEDAAQMARALVFADLRGVDTHGLIRLPMYVRTLKSGGMDVRATVSVIRDQGPTALLDGHNGISYVSAGRAMELAIAKAREFGVGAVGLRNAGHIGALAFFSTYALEHRMIGFAGSNTTPLLAPTGGTVPLLGHNPWSVAVPTGGDTPVVLDMANSTVARGKIRLAAVKGEKIPLGWAFNKRGEPTTDPEEAMDGGFLTPMGGYKGYGITLLISILCGLLTGARLDSEIPDLEAADRPKEMGQFFMALKIEAFVPFEEFSRRIREVIHALRNSPKAAGVERIYVPGEIEHRCAEERRRNGIPEHPNIVKAANEVARELGVPPLE
ncbi:MAG: Ldh family oxidoreductase [Deltaproteobacteria bacterium]|nr:Ldh family oxidoreductase [Deltaproteobacteria bacterium]